MKLLNKVSIGSWISVDHLSVAEVMSDAGFDWLCIDLEHTTIDYSGVLQLISTIELKGLIPFVRVGDNDPLIIKRVLDAGAKGIIVPFINSKLDAEKAVSYVKYPPFGERGIGSIGRAQGYGFNFEKYFKNNNRESTVIVQIEHIEAIKNLETILQVKGIDGSIIGPNDLYGSIPGSKGIKNKKLKEALVKYERISKKLKKPLGFHVVEPNSSLVKNKIRKGYTFIALSWDLNFLGTKCRDELNKLKNR